MAGESSGAARAASSLRADKNVRKKLRPWEREIPFADLVRLASPTLTDKYLSRLTGADPRTARRWLRKGDQSEGGERAMRAITVDILSRVRF